MALRSMRERYVRPDWVRRVNAMDLAAGGARHAVPIDAGQLIDLARASTGVDEPGDLGDGDWEGRLRALVDAVNLADLHVVGRLMTREELLRGLRTRLLLGARLEREPGIRDEVIDRPIFVTGPARSGTTILFELLALDEGVRAPIATDVLHPASPDSWSDAERIAATEAEQELWADIQPEFATMHELRSDLPVECITFNSPSFAGNHWMMVLGAPQGWAPDLDADLAFHRLVLQAVQHGKPPRQWLLKTPGYVFMLDQLLAAYPDASIIFTHRDPARTMPSTVSTAAMVQWLRTDDVDLDGFAVVVGALFTDALNAIATRRADGTLPGRHGDVRFGDLMARPTEAVRGAYEQLGRALTPTHAEAIESYLRDKPRGKHGAHTYTAEDWGFDAAALHRDLAPYMGAFDVRVE
jgi:hypothetical protein